MTLLTTQHTHVFTYLAPTYLGNATTPALCVAPGAAHKMTRDTIQQSWTAVYQQLVKRKDSKREDRKREDTTDLMAAFLLYVTSLDKGMAPPPRTDGGLPLVSCSSLLQLDVRSVMLTACTACMGMIPPSLGETMLLVPAESEPQSFDLYVSNHCHGFQDAGAFKSALLTASRRPPPARVPPPPPPPCRGI